MTDSYRRNSGVQIPRRTFLLTSAVGGGAMALGACGMTKEGSTGPGSQGQAATKIVAVFDREIISLDPHGPSDVDEGTLFACRHIFGSLVVRSGTEYKPNLATKWSQLDDKTWQFTLRDGVNFQDGKPLTSKDVKASLERVAKSDTPQAALWPTLDTVEAGDGTVTIHTKEPLGTMLANLSLLFVAPADKLTDASFFNKPLGAGPFKVDSFTPSDHVNLVASTDYWGEKPKLKRLESPYIPEMQTRLTSLKSGDVDVTWSVPPDQVESLRGSDGITVDLVPSYVYYFNWFNCSRKPFTDPRVRRAMWYALDVNTVVNKLFGDTAKVATAPIPTTVFGHAPQTPYTYDPDKAKSLLAQAGYPNGFSTSLMWSTGIAPQIRSVAQSFSSYWSKIGVKVKLEELEQATWLKRLVALDWDMDLQNNSSTTGDADFTLGRLYTTEANRQGYSNKKLDGILAQARSETDQKVRKQLYGQACKIIWDDAVGIFPMDLAATYALRTSVKGFQPAANNQPLFTAVSVSS